MLESYEENLYADKSPIHGMGCFAARNIKKGEYLGDYLGPASKKDGIYVLWVQQDDGSYRGINGKNTLKYLNHSSKNNAEFDGQKLFSTRSIKKDQEITIHYGEEWADV